MVLTKCQKDMLFNSAYSWEFDKVMFVCNDGTDRRGVTIDLDGATDCDIQEMIHNLLYSLKPYCDKCARNKNDG